MRTIRVKVTRQDGATITEELPYKHAVAELLDVCDAVTIESESGTFRYTEIRDLDADADDTRAEHDSFKLLYEGTAHNAETMRAALEDIEGSRMGRAETIERAKRALAEVEG